MFLNKDTSMNWKRLALAAVVAAGIAAAGFAGLDTFSQPWFRNFDFPVFRLLGEIGKWKNIALASLAVFVLARIASLNFKMAGARQIVRLSANIFCSVVLAEFVVGVLKVCVGRMRPVIFDALGQTGFSPFSMSDIWHSFPSGHAAAAFAALVSVGLMYPKARFATWPLAIVVVVARVCVGRHFPSDVLVGAFIGMAAADIIVWLRQKKFNL